MRGYFGVAIYRGKNSFNFGTLFRSANILGAKYLAVIGPRFKRQASDVLKSDRHIPVFEFKTFDEFYQHLPYDCRLVGIEMTEGAELCDGYNHPERAIYLLGAEDDGLPPQITNKCHEMIKLRGDRSFNVSVAGSIVIYDRTKIATGSQPAEKK